MAIRVTLDDRASKNFLSAANTAKPLSWPSLAAPLHIGAPVTFTREVILEFRKSPWTLQPPTALRPAYAAPVQPATFADTRTTAPKDVGSALTMATFHMLSFPPHHGEQRTAFTYRTALPCRTALANRTATVAAGGASTILIGSPVFTSAREPPSQAFQPVRGNKRLLLPGQC